MICVPSLSLLQLLRYAKADPIQRDYLFPRSFVHLHHYTLLAINRPNQRVYANIPTSYEHDQLPTGCNELDPYIRLLYITILRGCLLDRYFPQRITPITRSSLNSKM